MKKSILLLGAAGLLFTACTQQDDFQGPASINDSNVVLTIKLPGNYKTRAMNDGYTATHLLYAVYDMDNNGSLVLAAENDAKFSSTGTDADLTTTLALKLATNKTYNIALFATYEDFATATTGLNTPEGGAEPTQTQVYTFDAANQQIVVNYHNMKNAGMQADQYDCFYNTTGEFTVGTGENQSVQETVILYRPIAQINWGTDDLGEASVSNENSYGEDGEYIMSNLTTTAYNTLDMLTGDVTGTPVSVSVGLFEAPAEEGLQFPVNPESYTYIAMQYVLAPKSTSGTYDLNLNVSNAGLPEGSSVASVNKDIEVSSAPVQANYQTNIYGSLLTDNVNITVTKDPNWTGSFNTPAYPGENVGDDPDSEDLFYNESTGTYTIMTPAGLNMFAQLATSDQLQGTMAVLGSDLNMSGVSFTPFQLSNYTFDGNGKTISNLSVTTADGTYAGLFTNLYISNASNIIFENPKIVGNSYSGVLSGYAISANINNITVNGGSVVSTPWESNGFYDDGNNIGGVVGYLSGENVSTLTNCNVNDMKVTGFRNVGGLVGRINASNVTVTGNTVNNTVVTANQNLNGGQYTSNTSWTGGYFAGEIYGDNHGSNNTIENNTANNVTVLTVNSENELEVSSIEGLQQVANIGQMSYSGKTITFAPDITEIDLNNAVINPISFGELSTDFAAVFDGNGVTIKNFTIQVPAGSVRAALFNGFSGTFKNLNIENMTVETNTFYNSVGVIGYCGGGTITEVNVTNSHFNAYTSENTGAIIGLCEGKITMTQCTVSGCTLTDDLSAGGLIGYISGDGSATISDCTVENTTITTTTENAGGIFVGSYQGIYKPNVTYGEGNTVTSSTVNNQPAEVPSND